MKQRIKKRKKKLQLRPLFGYHYIDKDGHVYTNKDLDNLFLRYHIDYISTIEPWSTENDVYVNDYYYEEVDIPDTIDSDSTLTTTSSEKDSLTSNPSNYDYNAYINPLSLISNT